MSIEGRIAVDVNFTDSATNPSAVKKIQLVAADAYTSGKVAVVSGTVGTSDYYIDVNPTTFRGADGQIVSFTNSVTRVAFAAVGVGTNIRQLQDSAATLNLRSGSGSVAVGNCFPSTGQFTISAYSNTAAGTAAYTAVFYGS